MIRKRLKTFPRTDAGNAESFASVHRDRVRYDHKLKRWLVWDGNWWREDANGSMWLLAKAVARVRGNIAATLADDDKNKGKELAWAEASEARARLDAMLKLARSEAPIADSGENWDTDAMLLGVGNGVIDLRTGALRNGNPEDKISLHSDIVYDPEAQCPRFRQFIEETVGADQELIGFIQTAIGYCLTGSTREQCLFVCQGGGSNGKSTLLEVMRYVLGGYAHSLPFSAFELDKRSSIPNDLAPLPGKRFVTAIETNEYVQLNEGRIKLLTGCDPINARFLHREFFTFVPKAKYFLSFNNAPTVTDDSHGFWRRIRVIPFRQQFDGAAVDNELLEKLKAEAPGILAWAVQGCLKWQAQGLGMPQAIKEASVAYREDNDPLADFIDERCTVAPTAHVEAGALWDAYISWASDSLERDALKRKGFSRRLLAKRFKKERLGKERTWTWLGIGLAVNIEANHALEGVAAVRRTDADVKFPFVAS